MEHKYTQICKKLTLIHVKGHATAMSHAAAGKRPGAGRVCAHADDLTATCLWPDRF